MQSFSYCIRTNLSLTSMCWVAMGYVFWSYSRWLIYRESPDWLHLQLGPPNWSQTNKSINNYLIVFLQRSSPWFVFKYNIIFSSHLFVTKYIVHVERFAFVYQGYVTNQLGSPCWWHACFMELCHGQCNKISPDKSCNAYIINGWNYKLPKWIKSRCSGKSAV